MRVAVVTDIHGNLGALVRRAGGPQDGRRPTRSSSGGDAALFGAHALECWQRVLELGWPLVQGNTDRYLANPRPALEAMRQRSPAAAEHLERNLAWARRTAWGAV